MRIRRWHKHRWKILLTTNSFHCEPITTKPVHQKLWGAENILSLIFSWPWHSDHKTPHLGSTISYQNFMSRFKYGSSMVPVMVGTIFCSSIIEYAATLTKLNQVASPPRHQTAVAPVFWSGVGSIEGRLHHWSSSLHPFCLPGTCHNCHHSHKLDDKGHGSMIYLQLLGNFKNVAGHHPKI